MHVLKTILVVDDNTFYRTILSGILSDDYTVLEADDGKAALEILNASIAPASPASTAALKHDILAVVLDLVLPVMDGYAFLEAIHGDARYRNLPVIVTTDTSNHASERKALSLGAWDFVSKPYDAEIIKFRLRNAFDRSQLSALKRLKYLADYDALTGIYNKKKFFEAMREMLDANPETHFALLRFDVDRFQLVNSFFGTEEGDRLLQFIALHVRKNAETFENAAYGRMESDIFCICIPYEQAAVHAMTQEARTILSTYNPTYDIVPSIGVYLIDEPALSVETMYNRASMAAKACKGNYLEYYAYYNESMSLALTNEQEITNEMRFARENGQFQIYFQPKYNLRTNALCGAEALVRWMHPQKGMIAPDAFIPVFERNGFITKLDFSVWEQTCAFLRRQMDQGKVPYPVSVNVSRVDFYNPKLSQQMMELVQRYRITPDLLNLELTESAYTDNPLAASETIAQLQSNGFVVMMDDFGSGYSSLNILKDIAIDLLKIDMRFLAETKIPGRGENILASVVRMAKWLNIPVITEGVETKEQAEFLRSIGCDYAQGYYFARPMPKESYEALCLLEQESVHLPQTQRYHYDALFAENPEMNKLFGSTKQAAAIYEFSGENIELLRVNHAYDTLLGQKTIVSSPFDLLGTVDENYRRIILETFETCVRLKGEAECEYMRSRADGVPIWVRGVFSYVSSVAGKSIITGEIVDITLKKEIGRELERYRTALLSRHEGGSTILVVDDAVTNRMILKKIFENQFRILEVEDGVAALALLHEKGEDIDLILLDLSMPKMDGKAFLAQKRKIPALDRIPVIMITVDDAPAQQVELLGLGASDYILKPFIPEVVVRRVKNVLGFNRSFKEMIREYSSMSERVKTDQMTGLLNRTSAEEMIVRQLEGSEYTHAMMMLDIDNFKQINDTYGHSIGDEVLCAVAAKLASLLRQNDIVARMGGDEFSVFISNIQEELAESKAFELCKAMEEIVISDKSVAVTCSVGVVVSADASDTFALLYTNADKALYHAKCNGKGSVSVFGKEALDVFNKRVSDAEGILNDIQDGLYICDNETYDLLYVNDYVCNYMGVDKKTCLGKKCYELLMHRTAPCDFCSRDRLSAEGAAARIFRMPGTDKVFLMRGKKLNWNGVDAHMEIAIDVTQIQR